MLRSDAWMRRALALGATASLVLAACGGGGPSATPAPPGETTAPGETTGPEPTPGDEAKRGGKVTILSFNEEFDDMDPQRVYTGEDLAFFGATIMRSLTSFVYSEDPEVANTVTGDLAVDAGQPNADATEWSFTLRDGLTWEDGSELTCEDVKYGVSRTFANDVITNGPTYAIAYLDIPGPSDADAEAGWLSAYHGPYDGTGQELFDQAVSCNGKTITFKLKQPIADFNMTVTLGFSPVPESKDTGEQYTTRPFSNGPYKIEEYTTGNGGHLLLTRNENWNPESDPIRKAYPDEWEVLFGIDVKVIDQRIIESQGDDAYTLMYSAVQPENLATVFDSPTQPKPEFADRAVSDFDPYARYYWIDTNKIPNVKHRQAIGVALDREAIRNNSGGEYAGELGDGVIKPNLGNQYAPTGLWDGLLGQPIPDNGDPEYAKQLIAESGEPMPSITWDYPQTPVRDQEAAIVIDSLSKAGINVQANPIPGGQYYGIVFNDDQAHEFGWAGWGPDWPNASTIIGPLFTDEGGWNLSRVHDQDFLDGVKDALTELDPAVQAKKWQDLNKLAMERMYVVPTTFGLTQVIAGTGVAPTYQWAPYGSWAYAEIYRKPAQ
ncbi:MAG TPA: ABC transporter substrate-binding protein [Candidatus Binatia bacterium]|nr:ABC transporter substrate-binding protein [Candidatus Binatia bacterium]